MVKGAVWPLKLQALACLDAGNTALWARGHSLAALFAAAEGKVPKMLCCMVPEAVENMHAF